MTSKEQVLKQYFGYSAFREGQEALIDHILQKNDVLGIMPTGAGKSVCFQVPAMLFEGITVVISPLISLMRDQVQALNANGIPAAFINSSLNVTQTRLAIENARYGKYKIIYVAPERLDTEEFLHFAEAADISMVTVDEAHCVSQWGQDFRPSYLKINNFIDRLSKRPVLSAFTATATSDVKDDIIHILRLRQPFVKATGFDRENLYFEVQKPADKYGAVLSYLNGSPDKSGIIYCSTRKAVEQVCSNLQDDGFDATRYHAGLNETERAQNQDDFLYDRKTIMVATNAFGMGIDKSNVNFVLHYNMPKNIESYYQEAGRAGRDGTSADCILLYGGQDVVTNQFFIDNTNEQNGLDPEALEQLKSRERERLKQMTYYCHTTDCLRVYILRYFGDKSEDFCGNCGSCKEEFETVDILEDSKKTISCIYRMQEKFGVQMVIDTLRGSRGERVLKFRLDSLSTYGIMKDVPKEKVREIINYLVGKGIIILTNSEYPVAKLGGNYKEILNSSEPLLMKIRKAEESALKEKKQKKSKALQFAGELDQRLFAKLKELRLQIAAENSVPAFVIFSDATLIDMCRKKPTDKAELLEVSGVGEVKFVRYGSRFLEILSGHTTLKEEPSATTMLSKEELCDFVRDHFEPTEEAVPISVLTDMLNALLLQQSDCKLSPVKLSDFYVKKDFLQLETANGKNSKEVSPTGQALGISTIEKVKTGGERFRQNFYSKEAQHYAAEHIDELIKDL